MIRINTQWGKVINISCDIREIELWLQNRGIFMTEERITFFRKTHFGFIYNLENNPQLKEEIMWINPKSFSNPLEFQDTLSHELRHSKYPKKSENEILESGDEHPLAENMTHPKVMQLLWENYSHLVK